MSRGRTRTEGRQRQVNDNSLNWNGDFTFTGTQDLHLGNGAVTLSANANKQYGYAQVTQSDSSTVTVNGSIGIALRKPEATDVMNGTYNLNGGELKTRQIHNGTNAIRGTAVFNLHGGMLTYNDTVAQSDFINLSAGTTAGSGSLYLYETPTINTNGQDVTINQPIQAGSWHADSNWREHL